MAYIEGECAAFKKELGILPPTTWLEFAHRHFSGICTTIVIVVIIISASIR